MDKQYNGQIVQWTNRTMDKQGQIRQWTNKTRKNMTTAIQDKEEVGQRTNSTKDTYENGHKKVKGQKEQ